MTKFVMGVLVTPQQLGPVMEYLLADNRAQILSCDLYAPPTTGKTTKPKSKKKKGKAGNGHDTRRGARSAKRTNAAEAIAALLHERRAPLAPREIVQALKLEPWQVTRAIGDLVHAGRALRKGIAQDTRIELRAA